MNQIRVDPERSLGEIDRNIFGGFAEHIGRCIYGGIYEPDSPLADENGMRKDVIAALKRLRMPVIRYPGGNFASGYRWMDGIGPVENRPARPDLAWGATESNHFGTNEFIQLCRTLGTEPYLAVNCGDGDMREAAEWVQYCNSTGDTALAKLRREHGFAEPHRVKYWGIGNEVDGVWQIGYKTPQEYARAFTEFGKVMKWVDRDIKLIAAAVSLWTGDFVERAQLLLEQAGNLIDYMSLHWYVGNRNDDFAEYMTLSELFERRISAYEGLIRAMRLQRKIERPISIAVDEWNVWYRARPYLNEEVYNLEDALVVAMHFNAFIRHAYSVRMANIAQIVNVLAPILTNPDGLVLQTIYYPFELYSNTCGKTALDVFWDGDTFAGHENTSVRTLDVSATLDEQRKKLVLYVVNRSRDKGADTTITLTTGRFAGNVQVSVVNGPDIKTENTFDKPEQVGMRQSSLSAEGQSLTCTFEPHSVTAMVCDIS